MKRLFFNQHELNRTSYFNSEDREISDKSLTFEQKSELRKMSKKRSDAELAKESELQAAIKADEIIDLGAGAWRHMPIRYEE